MVLDGKKISQQVQYDWKPSSCSACATFSHSNLSCPLNPTKPNPLRGRSRSRAAKRRGQPSKPPVAKGPVISTPNPALPSQSNVTPPLVTLDIIPTNTSLSLNLEASSLPASNLLNDLNLLPTSPPIGDTGEQPLPTNSVESVEHLAGNRKQGAGDSNAAVTSRSPRHSHVLRSSDVRTDSILNDGADPNIPNSPTSSWVQQKGKKKGKK